MKYTTRPRLIIALILHSDYWIDVLIIYFITKNNMKLWNLVASCKGSWYSRTPFYHLPIPFAASSKTWVCGRSLAGVAGSNTAGYMTVCLLWLLCVFSGRGLCGELITRSEETYRLRCVWVWLWSLDNKKARGPPGLLLHGKRKATFVSTRFVLA